jgi:hypothetical protein
MNKLTIPVALAVLVMVLVAIFFFARQEKVLVFGESIDATEFLGEENPARSFADVVDSRLGVHLIDRFEIKTDDASVEAFISEEAPTLVSAEKTRSDQSNASSLADALQAVEDKTVTEEVAYESYDLKMSIDRLSWNQMLANDDLESLIQSMRQFAAADTTSIQQSSKESIRPIYVNRKIIEAICDLPKNASAIRHKVTADLQERDNQIGTEDIGIANFECAVLANSYIHRELDENVFVESPALRDYRNHIGLLSRYLTDLSIDGN